MGIISVSFFYFNGRTAKAAHDFLRKAYTKNSGFLKKAYTKSGVFQWELNILPMIFPRAMHG